MSRIAMAPYDPREDYRNVVPPPPVSPENLSRQLDLLLERVEGIDSMVARLAGFVAGTPPELMATKDKNFSLTGRIEALNRTADRAALALNCLIEMLGA